MFSASLNSDNQVSDQAGSLSGHRICTLELRAPDSKRHLHVPGGASSAPLRATAADEGLGPLGCIAFGRFLHGDHIPACKSPKSLGHEPDQAATVRFLRSSLK